MFAKSNVHKELLIERKKTLQKTDAVSWAKDAFKELNKERDAILQTVKTSNDRVHNNLDFDKIEADNIFHLEQIKKVCIDYRLRFLDTKFFKGDYPEEAISKIRQIEKIHQVKLQGYKIIAPSNLFVLKKADDPLLFVPMGNNYYYLIHKWGNDLHPLRKLKVWPAKNIGNLLFSAFLICTLLTALTTSFVFNQKATMAYTVMLFLFYFKFAIGFILFFSIARGKNFNEYIWKSEYNKVQ